MCRITGAPVECFGFPPPLKKPLPTITFLPVFWICFVLYKGGFPWRPAGRFCSLSAGMVLPASQDLLWFPLRRTWLDRSVFECQETSGHTAGKVSSSFLFLPCYCYQTDVSGCFQYVLLICPANVTAHGSTTGTSADLSHPPPALKFINTLPPSAHWGIFSRLLVTCLPLCGTILKRHPDWKSISLHAPTWMKGSRKILVHNFLHSIISKTSQCQVRFWRTTSLFLFHGSGIFLPMQYPSLPPPRMATPAEAWELPSQRTPFASFKGVVAVLPPQFPQCSFTVFLLLLCFSFYFWVF